MFCVLGYIIFVMISGLFYEEDKSKENLQNNTKDIGGEKDDVDLTTCVDSNDNDEPIKKELNINDINIRNIDPDHLDGYLMNEKKAILEKYYRVVKRFLANKVVF